MTENKPESLLHADLIKENKAEFLHMVCIYANKLGINANWMMQVMYRETGGTFSPSIRNAAGSGACGLIQIMPATANALDTTIQKLSEMSNVQQLYFVYKYFYPYRNRIKSFGDCYLAVFYPAAIGKPDDYLLPKFVTRQNAGLDYNKDGFISKSEIVKWAAKGSNF